MEAVVEHSAAGTSKAKSPNIKGPGTTQAIAAGGNASAWRDAAVAARNAVSTLLFEARERDEEERDDALGTAKRLISVANSEIGELVIDSTKDEFASAAFNVEAILQSALSLPHDPVGPEVRGMLTHALVIIDRLTNVLTGGIEFEALHAAIASKPSPVQRQETGSDFIDADRQDIVRLCGGEIMDWVSLIRLAQDHAKFDSEAINRLLPQILRRIETLGSIVMSGMGDRMESTEELGARLDGEKAV